MRFASWLKALLVSKQEWTRQRSQKSHVRKSTFNSLAASESLEARLVLEATGLPAEAHGLILVEPGTNPNPPLSELPHGSGLSGIQFNEGNRWSATFTDGSGLQQGDATTLRWGLLTDGSTITGSLGEATSGSTLIAFMDGLYGDGGVPDNGDLTQKPWFSIFNNSFNRFAAVSGLTFTYLAINDLAASAHAIDSSVDPLNASVPEILIGGHPIDGQAGSNYLAYNFFPQSGDMVIDTDNSSFYGSASNSSPACAMC